MWCDHIDAMDPPGIALMNVSYSLSNEKVCLKAAHY